MKKFLLTACCFVLIGFQSKAQLDTIPNAGFENWYYPPNWTVQATGWQSNNSSIAAWNVMPDSNSHSGFLSSRLEKVSYRGIIWSGFPISHHPLSLDGFMKNGLNIGDTAIILVQVYSSNAVVDSGYATIFGGIGTNFLPFTLSISQNVSVADSCVIMLIGGNISNSVIWFDDLSFTFPTSIRENYFNSGWMIFPVPCNEAFCVVGVNGMIENTIFSLRDVRGRIIWTKKIPLWLGRLSIGTESLPAGTYLLTITDREKSSNHLIIKN